jgi:3-oxoadipate enol-lactonase
MAQQRITIDGLSLSCEDRGSGPPIVLIHGFPLDQTMWEPQLDALCRSYRVIAPDLRGFGQSQRPDDDDVERGVGMERYAADVVGLLAALHVDEPVVVAGFSMGGYVAWQLVLRYPERVRGLIPCDTRAAADADEARAGRFKMAEAVMQAGNAEAALAMLPKLVAPRTMNERPDLVELIEAMILRQSPEAIAAAQRGMARREDVRGRLDTITADSLCIVGAADVISPPGEMHEIAALLAKSGPDDVHVIQIDDAGHLAPLENPAAVTAAIDSFARQCYGLS